MSHRRFAVTIWKDDRKDITYDSSKVKFLILGKEICPKTKKVHYQGYVETWKKIRMIAVKKIFNDNTMHVSQARDDRATNVNYCKKDKDYIIFNEEICLVEKLSQYVKDDYSDYDLLTKDPETYKNHLDLFRNIKITIEEDKRVNDFINQWDKFELNGMQFLMLNCIEKHNDVRKVIWFYDKVGNSGKSTLCNYLYAKKKCIILNNAKSSDIAYVYNGEPLVLFDIPRNLEGKINYSIIENLKNGRIFSTKYKGKIKFFKCPTIVVFANFLPEFSSLSSDRWCALEISGNVILHKVKW